MRLNENDLERLEAHMNSMWKNDCPMCGKRAWSSKGELTMVHVTGGTDGRGFPSIPVRCDNCGFMAGIDPFVAGLDLGSYGFSADA